MRFSVLPEFFCGFAIWDDFFFGFAVSNTPQCPPPYKLPFCSTEATKLVIFQFKLLHGSLATNVYLNKTEIRENDICTFCRTEKESLFHLFWSCSETFLAGLYEMVGRKPNKTKIQHFHSRYNNWPEIGHHI